MPETEKDKTVYENNPFMVAVEGISLLFNKARAIAIILLIVSVLSAVTGGMRDTQENNSDKGMHLPNWPLEQWLMVSAIVTVILLAILFISCMISGISAYAAAQIAKGNEVSLKEAFSAVLESFFSYIWLQILTAVKILLWSLLLIVPGIIMSFRYSLANVAFFDKGLRGNAAIKESIRLTNGAWITTYASHTLFNLITLGVITEALTAGTRAVLYRQFSALKEGEPKPDAHVLSKITLFLPLILVMVALVFLGLLAVAFNAGK